MTQEKWDELVGRVKDSFPVIREGKEELDPVGTADFIEFNGPLGHIRLEFVQKPVRISMRGMGSKRIGSTVQLEAQYSDEDIIQSLRAYRKDEAGEWAEFRDVDRLLK